MHFLLRCAFFCAAIAMAPLAWCAVPTEYQLGPADVVKISVYQNPDLAVEARIADSGQISYPLLGQVAVAGLSVQAAESKIAKLLRDGGFVRNAQVSIFVLQLRSAQVSVLGQVGRPGRYPIETLGLKASEMIALAGGVVPGAADVVEVVGIREGKPVHFDVDLPTLVKSNGAGIDPVVAGGDMLYVDRAPVVYIYGEVQRPGAFRLERGMSLLQGLALGGGLTSRGTERGIRIHRRNGDGAVRIVEPTMTDLLERDDVVYVKESFF